MMTKLIDSENTFRTNVHDNAVPYFCEHSEFVQFFNEAENEACIRKNLLFDRSTASVCEVAVAVGDQSKTINPLIIQVKNAYLDNGTHYNLGIIDAEELEYTEPDWRSTSKRPDKCIVEDKTIRFNAKADGEYTLRLEVYRLPLAPIRASGEPEIAEIHHEYLLEWAYHKYYSKRDTDVYRPDLAAEHERRFVNYFGERPTANRLRNDQANRQYRGLFI